MRVFLAGATGVIGRPLVAALTRAGHEVTAMSRTEEGAKKLDAAGVHGVVCDVFDRDALVRVVGEARPEAVLHQMTALPKRMNPRRVKEETAATNRLRTEGARNLLDAALAAHASRFVAQNIAFITKPEGPSVLDETAPLYLDGPGPDLVRASCALEEMVCGARGIIGVVLRYGFFYGPGTVFAPDGAVMEDLARGRVPIVGDGAGIWSFLHVDDAATATLAALERGEGVYNVTDDDPATSATWVTELYARRGKKPLRVPAWLARLVAGPYGVFLMNELHGASNAKAKRELAWSPARPSWRGALGEEKRADPKRSVLDATRSSRGALGAARPRAFPGRFAAHGPPAPRKIQARRLR